MVWRQLVAVAAVVAYSVEEPAVDVGASHYWVDIAVVACHQEVVACCAFVVEVDVADTDAVVESLEVHPFAAVEDILDQMVAPVDYLVVRPS